MTLLVPTLLSLSAFAGPPCTDRVALTADALEPQPVIEALADRAVGVGGPRPDCDPPRLHLRPADDGLLAALTTGDGARAQRTLSDTDAVATWVDSRIGTDRYADLLVLPPLAPPPSPAPEPVGLAVGADATAPIVAGGTLTLYATFEDWQARRPTGTHAAGLRPERSQGTGDIAPLVSVDSRRSDVKHLGKVFAFELQGRTFVSPVPRPPTRANAFGQLEVVGDHGIFPTETCFWNPATSLMQCFLDLKHLDLKTGDVADIGRPRVNAWVKQAGLDLAPFADAPPGLPGAYEGALRLFEALAAEAPAAAE